MASPSVPDYSLRPQRDPQVATLGWALRRAGLGLLILMIAVAIGAWLFNASIEPDGANAGPTSQSEYALPQN